MKWLSSAFMCDRVKLSFWDIVLLILGQGIKDGACKISLWRNLPESGRKDRVASDRAKLVSHTRDLYEAILEDIEDSTPISLSRIVELQRCPEVGESMAFDIHDELMKADYSLWPDHAWHKKLSVVEPPLYAGMTGYPAPDVALADTAIMDASKYDINGATGPRPPSAPVEEDVYKCITCHREQKSARGWVIGIMCTCGGVMEPQHDPRPPYDMLGVTGPRPPSEDKCPLCGESPVMGHYCRVKNGPAPKVEPPVDNGKGATYGIDEKGNRYPV